MTRYPMRPYTERTQAIQRIIATADPVERAALGQTLLGRRWLRIVYPHVNWDTVPRLDLYDLARQGGWRWQPMEEIA